MLCVWFSHDATDRINNRTYLLREGELHINCEHHIPQYHSGALHFYEVILSV